MADPTGGTSAPAASSSGTGDFSSLLSGILGWANQNPGATGALTGGLSALLSPTQAQTNTTQQQVNLPNYIAPYVGSLLNSAQNLASTPYMPYSGQRIADFTQPQQQAFTNIENQANNPTNATQTQGAGIVGQAANKLLGNAGTTWNSDTAAQYMSPYAQAVTNIALQYNQDLFNQQLPSYAADAVKNGAYGGDRQALVQANAYKNFNQQQNNIEMTGLNNAYNTGQQAYNSDKSLSNMAASNAGYTGSTLSNIGQQQFSNQLANNQNLLGIGNQQQALNQQSLTTGYNDYLTQLQYPYQQLQFGQSMLSGLPMTQFSVANTIPAPTIGQQVTSAGIGGYMLGNGLSTPTTNSPTSAYSGSNVIPSIAATGGGG